MSLKELIRTFEVLRDKYKEEEPKTEYEKVFLEEEIRVYTTAVDLLNELKEYRKADGRADE